MEKWYFFWLPIVLIRVNVEVSIDSSDPDLTIIFAATNQYKPDIDRVQCMNVRREQHGEEE